MKLQAAARIRAAISFNEAGHRYSRAAFDVLAKMAATINHASPGPGSPGTYTDSSCYGKVAHFLRNHAHLDPDWYLLLFRAGTDPHKIAHVCLYDKDGPVVDTFDGHPVFHNGLLWYQTKDQDYTAYPLTVCLSISSFYKQFVE